MSTPTLNLDELPADSLDAVIARLGAISVACISDAMDLLSMPTALIDPAISRKTGKRMAGRARTIDRAPRPTNATQADVAANLAWAPQLLWDDALPGDVAVMSIRGDLSAASIGDAMTTRALMRGAAGAVIDGAMRDVDAVGELGLTVYARASVPRSAMARLVTLSLNEPVICGGVYVRPGDVVVGDADGVVVVPAARAAQVADRAELLEARELQRREDIEAGVSLVESVKKYKSK